MNDIELQAKKEALADIQEVQRYLERLESHAFIMPFEPEGQLGRIRGRLIAAELSVKHNWHPERE